MVEFRILGSLNLLGADGHELTSVLAQPKRVALLTFLAAATPQRLHRRDSLVALFWPDLDQDHARAALRQCLHGLRRSLEDGVLVSRGDEDIGVDQTQMNCDAVEFERAAAAGRLADALDLYRGDLLEGFFIRGAPEFEQWLDGERARLKGVALKSATSLAQEAEARGGLGESVQWERRALRIAPLDEPTLRCLIQTLDRMGDRAGALDAYETFAKRIHAELEAEPAPETRALADAVRARIARIDSAAAALAPLEPEVSPPKVSPPSVVVTPRPTASRHTAWLGVAALALAIASVAASLSMRGRIELNPKRVFVAAMTNRTGDSTLDPLGNLAADWITQGLAQTGVLEIADPGAMVLGGRTGAAGLRDVAGEAGDVRRLALASGSGLAVSGAMYRRDDRIEFDAQITDEVNRKILRTLEPVVSEPNEPRVALETLRERLMSALSQAVDSRLGDLASTAGEPPRYDAYVAFSTGVEIFYSGRNARAALPYFQRAAALDSTYALPLIWAAWARSGTALDQCDSTAVIARRLTGMRLTPLEQMQVDRVMARCRGDLAAAYRLAHSLSEALPRSDIMKEQLARDALDWNRPREAVRILESLNPDSGAVSGRAGYYNWLTNAYHLLGQHDRELAAARRARQRFPMNVATLRMELLALAALGRSREVSERLSEIDAFPPDPIRKPAPVMREIALDLAAHGDTVGSRVVLAHLLAWHASRPASEQTTESLRFERAQAYLAAGYIDSARTIGEQLHRARPQSEQYAGLLGEVAALRGDSDETRRIDRLLTTFDGPFERGQATYWRACIAALSGERDQAVDLLARALAAGYVYPARYLDVHVEPSLAALRTDPRFQRLVRPTE